MEETELAISAPLSASAAWKAILAPCPSQKKILTTKGWVAFWKDGFKTFVEAASTSTSAPLSAIKAANMNCPGQNLTLWTLNGLWALISSFPTPAIFLKTTTLMPGNHTSCFLSLQSLLKDRLALPSAQYTYQHH